jgi:hypothetical protein
MLELSKVLADLRDELVQAQTTGEESNLRFLIDDIEVELHVVVTGEGEAKAGFKILTFGAEAKAKGEAATTQKLRLKLKIVDKTGKSPVLISDKDKR